MKSRLTVALLLALIFFTVFSSLLSPSLAADTQDYVDQTSNVDGVADKGTHSSFSAMQAGPDSTFDTLTEANTGGTFGEAPNSGTSYVATSANYMYLGVYSCSVSGYVTQVSFYGRGASGGYVKAVITDSGGNLLTDGVSDALSYPATAAYYTCVWSGNKPYVQAGNTYWIGIIANVAGRLYYYATTGGNSRTDTTNSYTSPTSPTDASPGTYRWRRMQATVVNYELDLEVQWVSADYDEEYEYLCVYTGTLNSEALKVDVWTGSSWVNVIASLSANQWNNVSVNSYLTSSTFTIRFKGATEAGDTSQSSWQIDCVLLHTWSPIADYTYTFTETVKPQETLKGWQDQKRDFWQTVQVSRLIQHGVEVTYLYSQTVTAAETVTYLQEHCRLSTETMQATESPQLRQEQLHVKTVTLSETESIQYAVESYLQEIEVTSTDSANLLSSMLHWVEAVFVRQETFNPSENMEGAGEAVFTFLQTVSPTGVLQKFLEVLFSFAETARQAMLTEHGAEALIVQTQTITPSESVVYWQEQKYTVVEKAGQTSILSYLTEAIVTLVEKVEAIRVLAWWEDDITATSIVEGGGRSFGLLFNAICTQAAASLNTAFDYLVNGKAYYVLSVQLQNPTDQNVTATVTYYLVQPLNGANVTLSSFSEHVNLEKYGNVTKTYTICLPIQNAFETQKYYIPVSTALRNPYTMEKITYGETLALEVTPAYFWLRVATITAMLAAIIAAVYFKKRK